MVVDRREYAQDIIVSSHCLLQNDIRYDDYSQSDRQRVSTSAEQIGKHIHTQVSFYSFFLSFLLTSKIEESIF
jgi:hypothetical protein